MDASTTIGEIDLITDALLDELAQARGPGCVSLFMPTHRAGPDTRQDPIRFRNLLGAAGDLLAGQEGMGDGEVDELLAPARALLDDTGFWQHQADGLALFVAPGWMRTVRVPLGLAEHVDVGERFALRPLLPLLTGDGHFFVLALSQNQVRLYEGTRFTLAELDRGGIPASMAEALAFEDPEAQLQLHTSGPSGMFHGHGEGGEVEKEALERYFRAVDRALLDRLGAQRSAPLVLAAVGYYLPIYAAASDRPALADRVVEGNPENRAPTELHAAAWEIVAPGFAAARDEAEAAYGQAGGAGLASSDLPTVVAAARERRIDTLFVAGTAPVWGRVGGGPPASVEVHDERRMGDEDLVDRVAVETLLAGGAVFTCDEVPSRDGAPAAARFRW
ncbi:MAG TPA: hypothetical protein VFZ77_04240 [Acidimicrobiales bacterium]